MNHFLVDTDIFALFLQNDPTVVAHVAAHTFDLLSISVITVQEVWNGWNAALARAKTTAVLAATYTRLADTLNQLRYWSVATLSIGAIVRYEALLRQKLNVGGNDLRIAAIALETGATVVTRNRRDFSRVPGLMIEDWSN